MAASWTVTGDLPDQFSTAGASTPVLGHTISFITGNGHRGSIFVANEQYTPTAVKAAIQVQANTVDEVNALSSKG